MATAMSTTMSKDAAGIGGPDQQVSAAVSISASDPRNLTSWEDAFHQPIGTVQKIEQQLRGHSNELRARLRSLAGASYRDLLGTADKIVQMDSQMANLDRRLATIGLACSRVPKSSRTAGQVGVDIALPAQLAILQACPGVIGRQVRQKSVLRAAKVYMLASLLRKTVAARPDCPPFVAVTVEPALARARRRLIRAIDSSLANPDADVGAVVDVLLAYALVTISTPLDAYTYFHRARRDAITAMLHRDDGGEDMPVAAIRLWTKTVRQSAVSFPGALIRGFRALALKPLVADPDLGAIPELQFRLFLAFVPPEIRSVAPVVPLGTLTESECTARLNSWISASRPALVHGLGENVGRLGETIEYDRLIRLRDHLLADWIRETGREGGPSGTEKLREDQAGVIDKLRRIFRQVMRRRFARDAAGLVRLTDTVVEVANLDTIETVPSVWQADLPPARVEDGAREYKKGVLARVLGRTDRLNRLAGDLASWAELMGAARAAVEQIRVRRWQSEFSDRDLDPAGPVSTVAVLEAALTVADPDEMAASLESVLSESVSRAEKTLVQLVAETERAADEPDMVAGQAGVVIRAVRILRTGTVTPGLFEAGRVSPVGQAGLVDRLYVVLAHRAVNQPVEAFDRAVSRVLSSSARSRRRRRYVAADLWEDVAGLAGPTIPSVAAVRLVRAVCDGASDIGSDLWVSSARAALRRRLRERVVEVVRRLIASTEPTTPEANKDDNHYPVEDGGGEEKDVEGYEIGRQQVLLVLLFDLLYLAHACQADPDEAEDVLAQQAGFGSAELADSLAVLRGRAGAYWAVSSTLFGVLGR